MNLSLELWQAAGRTADIEAFLDAALAPAVETWEECEGVAAWIGSPESELFQRVGSGVAARDGSALEAATSRRLARPAARELLAWGPGEPVPLHALSAELADALCPRVWQRSSWLVRLVRDEDGATIGLLALWGRASADAESGRRVIESMVAPSVAVLERQLRLRDAERVRDAALAERNALLHRLNRPAMSEGIVGADSGLSLVMRRVAQVASGDTPVLLLGETGSGKEVIARALHEQSRRADGPMVRVNCGAIAPELIDSELFGHEKGSFTGANQARPGWFERADGGTLLLDEVGELPLAAQVRLLRVLQDGVVTRVGGQTDRRVDVRIVAATHRDLEAMVQDGSFREDLWYRIHVFPIRIPPLRERTEDLEALARFFARRSAGRIGFVTPPVTPEDVAILREYPWPGNARELAAVIERAVILGEGRGLDLASALGMSPPRARPPAADLGPASTPLRDPGRTPGTEEASWDASVARIVRETLEACNWTIEGPDGAATRLHVRPSTLRSRMKKLGIRRPGG